MPCDFFPTHSFIGPLRIAILSRLVKVIYKEYKQMHLTRRACGVVLVALGADFYLIVRLVKLGSRDCVGIIGPYPPGRILFWY